MLPHRWEKVSEIFHAALDQPPEDWPDFLQKACDGDQQLRDEVESLLASHKNGQEFLQTSAVADPVSFLAQVDELLASGQQIGSYKIIKQIGRGGMGAVYLAERADELYRKHVALKLLKRGMDTDEVLRHFRNE